MSENPASCIRMLLDHIARRVVLTATDQDYLSKLVSIRTVLPRQYLLQQGDICRYEHYVCSGLLRSFVMDEKGLEHTLHFALEDWWITDLSSYVNKSPASRNIIAVEKTIVLQIDLEARAELMQHIPALESFWRILNEQACIAADSRILNNISMSGLERYEALIKKYPSLEQRLPQKHIASFLGITSVFLSQIRKETARR